MDYKESLAKNWCLWTAVLEKILESPLDCKEIQPVYPKGNQSWIFTGRTDAEAETPILWPLDTKNWLIGKDPDAGKDWRQEERETIEDEMVGWHHWFDGHECEQAPGVGDGQGSLVCCSPWVRKELDTTETELNGNSRLFKSLLFCVKQLPMYSNTRAFFPTWNTKTTAQKAIPSYSLFLLSLSIWQTLPSSAAKAS